jgi:hypothetical protein
MAKLPSVKSIRREDLPPDVPSWIDNLLGTLSIFMESVYSALNRDISFTENIACNIRDFVVSTKSNYTSGGWEALTFPSGLRFKPSGVLILQISDTDQSVITSPVSLDWQDLSGTIQIRYISGLANSKKYNVRLLVL